jgi:hypothetical protein
LNGGELIAKDPLFLCNAVEKFLVPICAPAVRLERRKHALKRVADFESFGEEFGSSIGKVSLCAPQHRAWR